MITGAGIDLFDVVRMEREVARQGSHLLDELFSITEQVSCATARRPCRSYAARFAVKEACFKALGTGKIGRMAWRDIETATTTGGGLAVTLTGETARVASELGVCAIRAAVSMTRDLAMAWVVATGPLAEERADAV